VTLASVAAAAVADRFPEGGAPWQVRKVYYVVWPQSVVRRAIQVMRVLESCGRLCRKFCSGGREGGSCPCLRRD
jgi:hypothetical protein